MACDYMSKLLKQLVLRPWWRLTRAVTLGVRGIVHNGDGEVLLVRHSYTPGWHLPGGGVEHGETLRFALARELQEEGGVEPAGEPRLHGIFANRSFAGDHVVVFVIPEWRAVPSSHGYEITGCDFFPLDALPDGTTRATKARLDEVFSGTAVSEYWTETD